MKILCSKNDLTEAINIVSKAVSTRTPLPILECILLTADESGFKLIANDMELGIETSKIEANIIEHGMVALESKMFSEIIRRLPDVDVSIETDEINVTKIISGKSEFKLLGQSGDEFPVLPLVEKNICYHISSSNLRNMIRQTIFSVATEETRPVLTGELFDVKDSKLSLVAVDGFRVSVRESQIKTHQGDIRVVIPSKTLSEISKILPVEKDAEVTMYFTDRHVLFELENCIVVSRILEGEFIKYEQAFSTDTSINIELNRHLLLNCLERASLMSRDSKKSPVNLKLDSRSLIITSQTEAGVFNEEILVFNNDKELDISFNPKYLMDILKAIESEAVTLRFSTNLSPCIISGSDGIDYRYLVLPLRVKG